MRVNCWVPDDLAERVREELPDANVSAVLQEALRQMLECGHEHLTCSDCGGVVDRSMVGGAAMRDLWRELLWAWGPLVDRDGTAVGAATVGKGVAVRMGVPGAEMLPLPRPARAMREAS